MTFRFTAKTLTGAAAMLALGVSVAAAQAKPTSTKRIPISKEAPGEVLRVDTVTVTRYVTDTLRIAGGMRIDTIRTTNTVYRVDTVTAPVPPIRLPGGMYFGVAAGVVAPNGALYNPNSAGPSFQAQLGWQKNMFGLRADVNYAQPGEDSQAGNLQANPDILNFSLDGKLALPFFTHLFGAQHRFALYGIGGYTHTMYKNLPIRVDGLAANGQIIIAPGKNEWTNFNGWNAGGGASLGWGRTELFVESRILSFNPENTPSARQMPFMLGINFY